MKSEIKNPHLTQSSFVAIVNGKRYEFPTEEEFDEFIESLTQALLFFRRE